MTSLLHHVLVHSATYMWEWFLTWVWFKSISSISPQILPQEFCHMLYISFFYIPIRKSFLSLNINNRKIWATVRKLFMNMHKNFIKLYNFHSLKVRSRKRLQFVHQKSQVKDSLKEMTCFKPEKVGPGGIHVKKILYLLYRVRKPIYSKYDTHATGL